jgi:hypothetical protein
LNKSLNFNPSVANFEQVQNFIKAIFADSSLRKECLGWILRTPA